jgi:hypothetical protein
MTGDNDNNAVPPAVKAAVAELLRFAEENDIDKGALGAEVMAQGLSLMTDFQIEESRRTIYNWLEKTGIAALLAMRPKSK